jgi:hypothetical protein
MATTMTKKKADNKLAPVPDAILFEQDAGVGNEEVGEEDLALPFLKLLQASSQKTMKQLKALGIDASPGDVWNSVTNEIYSDRKLQVIPVAYQRRFIEWTPRGDGNNAPVAIYTPNEKRPETTRSPKDNKDYTEGGQTYIEDTHHHYLLVLNADGTSTTALVTMKSTMLKKSRKWNSMIASRVMTNDEGKNFSPPRFAYVYTLQVVEDSNDEGEWFNWDVTLEGPVENVDHYQEARQFAHSIKRGTVTVKHQREEGGAEIEDDVPF